MKWTTAITVFLLIPASAYGQLSSSDAGTPAVPFAQVRRVYPGGLRPRVREALRQMGDRLQSSTKSRISYSGSWSLLNNPSSANFQLIWEFPGRLKLDQQLGGKVDSLIFDGFQFSKPVDSLGPYLPNALETLLFDSPEHFFLGQANGLATRCLGEHARTDDGTDADYSGPFYDVYLVYDQVARQSKSQNQAKLYYFDSATLLLEKVKYDLQQGSDTITVEIQYEDWKLVLGHLFPGKITRLENGAPTMIMNIASAQIGPQLNDGTFSIP